MKLLAGVAVLLAIGAGLGTYFGLRSSTPEVPKAQQSPILERAKTDGLISSYRVLAPHMAYEVAGGQIDLRRMQLCNPNSAGPCFTSRPLIAVEYRRPVQAQALALWRLAQKVVPNAEIKLFEVTPGIAESHIPDSRIMLIPKAGS
jgi:hypothetical protein